MIFRSLETNDSEITLTAWTSVCPWRQTLNDERCFGKGVKKRDIRRIDKGHWILRAAGNNWATQTMDEERRNELELTNADRAFLLQVGFRP